MLVARPDCYRVRIDADIGRRLLPKGVVPKVRKNTNKPNLIDWKYRFSSLQHIGKLYHSLKFSLTLLTKNSILEAIGMDIYYIKNKDQVFQNDGDYFRFKYMFFSKMWEGRLVDKKNRKSNLIFFPGVGLLCILTIKIKHGGH